MRYRTLLLLILLILPVHAQTIIKDLPGYETTTEQLSYYENSDTRSIIPLNGKWNVREADEEDAVTVQAMIPSIIKGETTLLFEKEFRLKKEEIAGSSFYLTFLGISHAAEIVLNNAIIGKHPGGEYPFSLLLPQDQLRSNEPNRLSVKVIPASKSGVTFPLSQRFQYPAEYAGIFRDVYIRRTSIVHISDYGYKAELVQGKTVKSEFSISLENLQSGVRRDSAGNVSEFTVQISISDRLGGGEIVNSKTPVTIRRGSGKNITVPLSFSIPQLWSPESPVSYTLDISLLQGERTVDQITLPVSFFSLKAGEQTAILNGSPYRMNGVTYYPSNGEYGMMSSYAQMEKDLRLIKDAGFNAVRFARHAPHPYLLYVCRQIGLIAFIELPVGSIPEQVIESTLFFDYAKSYLTQFVRAYRNFSSIGGIGLGHSYISTGQNHRLFLSDLGLEAKKLTSATVYASFADKTLKEIENIDLYGYEFHDDPLDEQLPLYEEIAEQRGSGRVFISEAGYIANLGATNGRTNAHSQEAQAYFYEQLLSFMQEHQSAGFFIKTMFDFRAHYQSIVSGYNEHKVIYLGVLGEDRNPNRLGYKVIQSFLQNKERKTIPLGVSKDDAPFIFIIFGIMLAILIGLLFNSGRKFREDAGRALLRPYNFFSDVRDLRQLSVLQTTILALILSASISLLVSNILSGLRYSTYFERVVGAFGSETLLNAVSYLAWHPMEALLILSAAVMAKFLFFTLIIKFASLFVTNKVYLSNAYHTMVWSFLPFGLLIPVGTILYRVMHINGIDTAVWILLGFFVVSCMYRLFKGIYVIFDIHPRYVYIYGIFVIVVLLGGIMYYFQSQNAALDYLFQTIQEFSSKS